MSVPTADPGFDDNNFDFDIDGTSIANATQEAANGDGGSRQVTKNLPESRVEDETGICIQRYRKNVLAWFEGHEGETLEFGAALKGERAREVSRHLLAVLHFTNEGKLEIESQPMIMDRVLLRKVSG